jgi:hypothetical protein
MTLLLIASLLIPMTSGVFLTLLILPPAGQGKTGLALRLSAGGGLGVGVGSLVYFLCLLAGIARYTALIEIILCLVLGLLCFVRLRKRGCGKAGSPPAEARKGSRLERLIAALFAVELVASLVSFTIAALKEPHGRWDAWLIWNMHARFLFRGGAQWREAFASGLDWSHWDYPLMLPASIARGWTYLGDETLPLPAVMGFLFTFLVIGLLTAALAHLRGRSEGWLAGMILMGTPFLITMGASQFADVPLAFFILATLALLNVASRCPENPTGALVLAGLAAGLCAWTKNEGLLFMLIAAAGLLVTTVFSGGWRLGLQRTAGFIAGALPVLLIVVYFKTRIAPVNDLMAGLGPEAAAKLLDWGRYGQITRAFFVTGLSFTQGPIDVRAGMSLNPGTVGILLLAAYLFLTGIRIDREGRIGPIQTAAILVAMLAGYFVVYVLTPLDLDYHLMTSLNRLFIQLWPGILFAVFMIAGPPATIGLQPQSIPPPKPGKVKKRRPAKETK